MMPLRLASSSAASILPWLLAAALLFMAAPPCHAFLVATPPTAVMRGIVSLTRHDMSSDKKDTSTSSSTTSNSSSLSNLVSDMLQSQREMQHDMQELEQASSRSDGGMPVMGDDGIYRIASEQEYKNFFATHSDQLLVVKFSSRTCQACKALHQKFRNYIHREAILQQAPVVFADVTVVPQRSTSQPAAPFTTFVTQQLKVTRIPDVHFYTSRRNRQHRRVDQFNCDPTDGCSWGELKDKMVHFCHKYGRGNGNEEGARWSRLLPRWFSSSSSSSTE